MTEVTEVTEVTELTEVGGSAELSEATLATLALHEPYDISRDASLSSASWIGETAPQLVGTIRESIRSEMAAVKVGRVSLALSEIMFDDDGDDDDDTDRSSNDDDDDDDDDDHKQRVDEHDETGARFQVVIEFSAGCRQVPIGPVGRESVATKSLLQSHIADTLDGEIEIKTWRGSEERVEKLEILHTTSLDNFEEMLQNLLSKVKYATMADEWNVRRVRPLFNKKQQNSMGNRSSRDSKVAPKGSPYRSEKRHSSRPNSPVMTTPTKSLEKQ